MSHSQSGDVTPEQSKWMSDVFGQAWETTLANGHDGESSGGSGDENKYLVQDDGTDNYADQEHMQDLLGGHEKEEAPQDGGDNYISDGEAQQLFQPQNQKAEHESEGAPQDSEANYISDGEAQQLFQPQAQQTRQQQEGHEDEGSGEEKDNYADQDEIKKLMEGGKGGGEDDDVPPLEPTPKPRKTFAPVDTSNPSPTGMTGRRVNSDYDGEHNMMGWRTKIEEKRGNTKLTTALYSEQQRKDNTLVMKDDKTFERGDGTEVSSEKLGYAMDPKTGEMSTFKDGSISFKQGEQGREDVQRLPNLQTGVDRMKKDEDLRVEINHHSTALGGDAVTGEDGQVKKDTEGRPVMQSRAAASAGYVEFDFAGRMIKISNSSGHYKPLVSDLMQAVEFLSKQGAFLGDRITNAQGKILSRADEGYQLYQEVQGKMQQIPPLMKQAETLTGSLDDNSQSPEQIDKTGKELEKLLNQVEGIQKAIEKPLDLLRKLGIGPSQQTRRHASAEFLDVKPGMTGLEVRQAETKTMGVDEFLQSGGGNTQQKSNKDAMLEELKNATSRRRGVLDTLAKVSGPRVAPTGEEVTKALKTLRGEDEEEPGEDGPPPQDPPPNPPGGGNEEAPPSEESMQKYFVQDGDEGEESEDKPDGDEEDGQQERAKATGEETEQDGTGSDPGKQDVPDEKYSTLSYTSPIDDDPKGEQEETGDSPPEPEPEPPPVRRGRSNAVSGPGMRPNVFANPPPREGDRPPPPEGGPKIGTRRRKPN